MAEIDLATLGTDLRIRRRSLRIPSAELARRLEVSPTYVWLIEGAKRRSSGEPSRPSEDLLLRWTRVLGLDREETRRMLELAGYFDVDPDAPTLQRTRTLYSSPPPTERSWAVADQRQDSEGSAMMESMLDVGLAEESTDAQTRRWRRTDREETSSVEQRLVDRMRRLLLDARLNGRQEEVQSLLDSYLRWLAFYMADDRQP
jgi:transcriptional regulator with XRE-family HTH domain